MKRYLVVYKVDKNTNKKDLVCTSNDYNEAIECLEEYCKDEKLKIVESKQINYLLHYNKTINHHEDYEFEIVRDFMI